jgi:hypothetical protein
MKSIKTNDKFELDISFLKRRNQGERNTCLAYAVVSLIEYYLHVIHNNNIELSPDYLYARCKEKGPKYHATDGIENFESIFEKAKEGICLENDYLSNRKKAPLEYALDKYNLINERTLDTQLKDPEQDLKDLTPPDDVKFNEIPFHHIKNRPFFIEECKKFLRGDHGHYPMPVVIGCKIAKSLTDPNVKIQLRKQWLPRLGKKDPFVYHAMLVTGYCNTDVQDDEGGFFWVLNSWGESKLDDKNHKGMVKMSYNYFRNNVIKAETIEENIPLGYDNFQANATVVHHLPETKDMIDTSPKMQSKSMKEDLQITSNINADDFFNSVVSNLKQKKPACSLPYDLFCEKEPLLPLHKKIQIGEIQEPCSFMGFIRENYQKNTLKGYVKIIPLNKEDTFRIIVAALSCDNSKPICIQDMDCLNIFISERLLLIDDKASHNLVVVAAANFDDDCQNKFTLNTPPQPFILCTPTNEYLWNYNLLPRKYSQKTINFLLHTLPGQEDIFINRLASAIDNWPSEEYITNDKLREKLGLHFTPDAFLDYWLKQGGYHKDKDGHVVHSPRH